MANISDETYNKNFQTLLDKFHAIIKDSPAPEKVKGQLEALKEEAKTSPITARQSSAIYERCVNYANGGYGSTSKEHKVQTRTKER